MRHLRYGHLSGSATRPVCELGRALARGNGLVDDRGALVWEHARPEPRQSGRTRSVGAGRVWSGAIERDELRAPFERL